MRKIFGTDSTNCRILALDEWQQRYTVARCREIVLIPFRPFL
ncbi:hypothetical protein [Arthrobacter sp. efr-133-TYG-104]|nr:hypothetical protein [Arthrobacter sp. efr-133-TYG-104]